MIYTHHKWYVWLKHNDGDFDLLLNYPNNRDLKLHFVVTLVQKLAHLAWNNGV